VSSALLHFSSGIGTGGILGGAAWPLRSSLRVLLQSGQPVQPKYLPNRPVFSCIGLPHLSQGIDGPS